MAIWTFLGTNPHQITLLQSVSRLQIVDDPGIYVLLAPEGTEYRYPKATSPIFYIGRSDTLCDRIDTHRKRVQAVVDRRAPGLEWPRYEYAAAHGCRVAAFPADIGTTAGCKLLESDVIALFASVFGAPPVANGSANRDTVLRRIAHAPPLGLSNRPWLRKSPG